MKPAEENLLNAVLSLPESERIHFVDALLSTLPDDLAELDDDALEKELLRRSDEIDQDSGAVIPWSEVKKQIPPSSPS